MTSTLEVASGSQLIKSMRSGRYKDTAQALAEIIDNSVEAGAKNIEILCATRIEHGKTRKNKQIENIVIIDDGGGMNEKILQESLVLGQGTRFERKGIGRFGMGLPQSSISQCKTINAYSWQRPNEIFSTGFTIDVPKVKPAIRKEIPKMWVKNSKILKNSQHGTLIEWSDLDALQWKRFETLRRNSEEIIGRIYRKFIYNEKLKITFVLFDLDTDDAPIRYDVSPNDPLYQMVPSSTPPPWHDRPMFMKDGDYWKEVYLIGEHKVTCKFTLGTKEAREPKGTQHAGSLPHGKHAGRNLGISIMRANRELCMDTNLCKMDDRERWWSVEMTFPNELDEIMGVSNDKQDVMHFTSLTRHFSRMRDNITSPEEDNDLPDHDLERDLYNMVKKISGRTNRMHKSIREMHKGNKLEPNFIDPDNSPKITDEQENLPFDEKIKVLASILSRTRDEKEAIIEAEQILKNKYHVKFEKYSLGSYHFFEIDLKGGIPIITVNTDHDAYKYLIEPLEKISKEQIPNETVEIIDRASLALDLLFFAWANLENHEINPEKRKELSRIRFEWGEKLSELMKQLPD